MTNVGKALQAKEWKTFEYKKIVLKIQDECRDEMNAAFEEMNRAWMNRCVAEDVLNTKFEELQELRDQSPVWCAYKQFRAEKNEVIAPIRTEMDAEHDLAVKRTMDSMEAFQDGLGDEAKELSEEANEHRRRRDELNAKINSIIQEIRDEKAKAEAESPIDDAEFVAAKSEYDDAKKKHYWAHEKYLAKKAEYEDFKNYVEEAKAEHREATRAYEEYLERLCVDET